MRFSIALLILPWISISLCKPIEQKNSERNGQSWSTRSTLAKGILCFCLLGTGAPFSITGNTRSTMLQRPYYEVNQAKKIKGNMYSLPPKATFASAVEFRNRLLDENTENQHSSILTRPLPMVASRALTAYHWNNFAAKIGASENKVFPIVSTKKGSYPTPYSGYVEVNERDKLIFIVLRGTKIVSDWMSNTHVSKVKGDDIECGVHEGYLRLTNVIYPQIKSIVLENVQDHLDNYEVIVSGHSLGGAVATLLGPKLYFDPYLGFSKEGDSTNTNNRIKVLSFSSPKVFCDTFRGEYPLGDRNLLRVHHKRDPVVSTPPFGYRHLGNEYVIDQFDDDIFEKLKQRQFPDWVPDWFRNIDEKIGSITAPAMFHDLVALIEQLNREHE